MRTGRERGDIAFVSRSPLWSDRVKRNSLDVALCSTSSNTTHSVSVRVWWMTGPELTSERERHTDRRGQREGKHSKRLNNQQQHRLSALRITLHVTLSACSSPSTPHRSWPCCIQSHHLQPVTAQHCSPAWFHDHCPVHLTDLPPVCLR